MTHTEYLDSVAYMLFQKGKDEAAEEVCPDCGELSEECRCIDKKANV
jgi:hypothetical protein